MGKTQHGKDKMYITQKEWADQHGVKKAEGSSALKRLPFHCCALSLTDFTHPVMTPDGYVFDLSSIVPFIRKYHINPTTGESLSGKDLIKLSFEKNTDGQYCCPSTGKVFTEHTKIAAIKTTGHVFSWDAINTLCIKPKNFRDLLNDEPFTKEDIVILQDPSDEEWMSKHNITNFYHMKAKEPGATFAGSAPIAGGQSIRMSDISKTVLKELHSRDDERSTLAVAAGMKRARDLNEESASVSDAHIRDFGVKTTGKFGASFTSTGMNVRTRNEAAPETAADVLEKRWRAVKALGKKGFVRIVTSKGNLNVELHCDLVPQTCDNFIQLCQTGYYNGTTFHRLIRNFMMQGGDPTGTGTGGDSVWGGTFPDEFHPKLLHSESGVLSMANSGKDSNKSQFFITFKMASHLDRKHSVFGRVVGGLDVLSAMGNTAVDKDNRPIEPITIVEVKVFQNPFDDVAALPETAHLPGRGTATLTSIAKPAPSLTEILASTSREGDKAAAHSSAAPQAAVGKYLPSSIPAVNDSAAPPPAKRPAVAREMNNFSGW